MNVDALSRDKFQVAVGDIIEISVPDEEFHRYELTPPPPPQINFYFWGGGGKAGIPFSQMIVMFLLHIPGLVVCVCRSPQSHKIFKLKVKFGCCIMYMYMNTQ